MKPIIFLTIFMMAFNGFTQSVRKVKIDQLISVIDSSDHPLVVNFWATWCAPCVEEIPWLQEGVEKYKNEKVELLLVSLDFDNEYPKGLVDFIKRKISAPASSGWMKAMRIISARK